MEITFVHRWLAAGMLLSATACYSAQGLLDSSGLSYTRPPDDAAQGAGEPPVLTDANTTSGGGTAGTTGGGTAGTTGGATGGTTGAGTPRRQAGMAMQLERDATRCLDTASLGNTNVLVMTPCARTSVTQRWLWQQGQLRTLDGRCVAPGGALVDNPNAVLGPCGTGEALGQIFEYLNGTMSVQSRGFALDATAVQTAYTPNGYATNQLWRMTSLDPNRGGFGIASTQDPNFCWAVPSVSPGESVRLQRCKDVLTQGWQIAGTAISVGGLCLALRNKDQTFGTPLILQTCGTVPDQQLWSLARSHIVFGGLSPTCATVQGSVVAEGTPVTVTTGNCNGGPLVTWIFGGNFPD
ncbi:MAG TPA: hypothetical protein VFH51_08675 [Myxococcota bacterium]|nr:hypothetical protein [Myxococcota bacterium]